MAFEYFYLNMPTEPDRRGKRFYVIGILLAMAADIAVIYNLLWILGK